MKRQTNHLLSPTLFLLLRATSYSVAYVGQLWGRVVMLSMIWIHGTPYVDCARINPVSKLWDSLGHLIDPWWNVWFIQFLLFSFQPLVILSRWETWLDSNIQILFHYFLLHRCQPVIRLNSLSSLKLYRLWLRQLCGSACQKGQQPRSCKTWNCSVSSTATRNCHLL